MKSLIHALQNSANRLWGDQDPFKKLIDFRDSRRSSRRRLPARRSNAVFQMETLESRDLLTTAIVSGDWHDPNTWEGGQVPDDTTRAIISHGITVNLDGAGHDAKELVIHGNLIVPEGDDNPSEVNKSLNTDWIHVNSTGLFQVGTEADRYDEGSFTLTLEGTDLDATHQIETNMMGMPVGATLPTTSIKNNGFLMTAMEGRVQFFGEEKLSFTKLAATVDPTDPAQPAITSIIVENVIERNFDKGEMLGDDFVTTAADDGALNWKAGDVIVIASSSYDYTEEEVREIDTIVPNEDGETSTITFVEPLAFKHYGVIETYGDPANKAAGTTDATQTYAIDLRAEVALLSRNIKIQGLDTQDTDNVFGDRANVVLGTRGAVGGLSPQEAAKLPGENVANGIGGHLMFMKSSGQITVDGVQLEGLGQSSQKGRYPIHWHLGGSKSNDVLRNSSVTNSNNRGVTIHGTSDLTVEGVVLHDIHGHGFFFEDAVETGNQLIGNIALGIHAVGGNDNSAASPGTKDPFIVDTHDSFLETGSRFSGSAAYWITNPTNTFVGNIAAGAGDQRTDDYADPDDGVEAGTGFWYALPRTAVGASSVEKDEDGNLLYGHVTPIYGEFGQFDNNTSHTTAVGLNFDRGSDIEDAHFNFDGIDFDAIQGLDQYAPRVGGVKDNPQLATTIHNFTNYKASEAAFYHRGEIETVKLDGLRVADSFNGPWAVSENIYDDSLFVGHSAGNGDLSKEVGGPRLYDGSGLYTDTHFAGFGAENAYAFQVEGSSFGPTMYHAFRGTSFEGDGSFDNIAHAVSDFTPNSMGHNEGQPSQWIKAVMDLDGTLTGGVNPGDNDGVGYSIVPNVDFLVDEAPFNGEAADVQPAGWDAWLTDDIYARMRIQNKDDFVPLFPSEVTGEPLVRFTARDGDSVEVTAGQDINGQFFWTQIAAKAEDDGFVDGTLTVEFLRNGLPEGGFVLNMDNQDGGRPSLVPEIQDKVNASRLVSKFVGASNYTPNLGTEVSSEMELRDVDTGVVYFRDHATGDLYLNTSIVNQQYIELNPGAPLQTEFASHSIQYGATIEAEAFDNGIEGIAYHDEDATNTLGSPESYRLDTGVDATSTAVGDLANKEWLEYTTDIVAAGYDIGLNVSSTAAGGQIRVLAATSNSAGFYRELGTVDVPDTGGAVTTVWLESPADLTDFGGTDSAIRVQFIGTFDASVELDSIQFAEATQTSYVPDRVISSTTGSTTIELEEFDFGGQGIAYNDTTAGNPETNDRELTPSNEADGNFRKDESVDTTESELTENVRDGEWLEYTTDIEAGVYNLQLNKVWGNPDNAVKIYVANSNSAIDLETEFTLLGEFDFLTDDNNEVVELNGIDLTPWAGSDRVIRIEIVGDWMGLDSVNFINTAAPQSAYVARAVTLGSPATIQLEEYDIGGQDIAYNDNTDTNDANDPANPFRPDEGVDTNGSIITDTIENGEWVEYTTDIEAGVYDVTLAKAWSAGSDSVRLLVGETNAATTFTDFGLFSFDGGGGEDITREGIDLTAVAGTDRVIRLEMVGSFFGLDSITFAAAPNATPPTADIVDVTPDPRSTDADVVTINFDKDVTGVDIADLTLTRDGAAVDISGLTVTQVSPSQYTVDLSTLTTADGSYELSLNSTGSGIQDTTGNALAADAIDQFLIDATGPQVESVVVNDGSAQRSMVKKITVTFSEDVNNVDASSFILMNTTTNTQVIPTVEFDGQRVATLTFSGAGIVGGSLADGNYSLTTVATAVLDATGNELDGDSDGTSGDDATDSLFRLFGDANGDRSVSIADFFLFRDAFGSDDDVFDFHGDGTAGIADFFQFRDRFGQTV